MSKKAPAIHTASEAAGLCLISGRLTAIDPIKACLTTRRS